MRGIPELSFRSTGCKQSPSRQPDQLAVTFKDGADSTSDTPNVPLNHFTARKIAAQRWTRIVIPLDSPRFAGGSGNHNTFWVQNNVNAVSIVLITLL